MQPWKCHSIKRVTVTKYKFRNSSTLHRVYLLLTVIVDNISELNSLVEHISDVIYVYMHIQIFNIDVMYIVKSPN